MRKMKLYLMCLTTVLISLSVCSCLSDGDNDKVQVQTFVQVNAHDLPVSFTNSIGVKLIPNQAITVPESKEMALINYQYDKTTVSANATSINITLLDNPYYFTKSPISLDGEPGNAPFVTLEPHGFRGGFFNKEILILPISFKYKRYSEEKELKEEIKRHTFAMMYDNEKGFKDGILTLHLHHTITSHLDEQRITDGFDYKAYDLSSVLSVVGSDKVTKVEVVIKENQYNNKYSEAQEKTYSYEYPFNKK
ncbi:hypothetical protein HMPREF1981_02483 [Bacteroides pyogenes F0041]|uniref:Lipoprotein n=1 Tax=Bacteroides pyogenes F0041 TaxID=1321819 RepID=U2C138_9BACE|nr:hypothetical protein [Bacteroides pyogenes]ERI84174.1 hypothetical protein HMPREF1981_02483 [Bacteroides pyogenes F0041]MBB3893861.1 hypothetical protein [Bacteroides pyogenes]SUV33876.1 putative lipoprotein [Bacteroides pyogenes]